MRRMDAAIKKECCMYVHCDGEHIDDQLSTSMATKSGKCGTGLAGERSEPGRTIEMIHATRYSQRRFVAECQMYVTVMVDNVNILKHERVCTTFVPNSRHRANPQSKR
jgi:hypothetical protein